MRVACLQMCSGIDRDLNLAIAAALLSEAAQQGAELAVLPENFTFMGGNENDKRKFAEDAADSEIFRFLSGQARQHQMVIIAGTLLLKAEGGLLRNACPVFDASGQLLAVYDKIHLFDMDYQGEVYHESDLVAAGKQAVVIQAGIFKVGLSVCYDLRFPELYRFYVDQGCQLLCNVAAFTATTGRVHWSILLQARAIENQSYVLASAQCGEHPDGRLTWGHSMIIDPWGEVLAELPEGQGVVIADVDLKRLDQVRSSLPALSHRKL